MGPREEDEARRQRRRDAAGWFRHSELTTWHYYDAPFSSSLCRGDYVYSLAVMQRGDGSSPYCCAGCAIELNKRRAA
jgi:hypothetical protein